MTNISALADRVKSDICNICQQRKIEAEYMGKYVDELLQELNSYYGSSLRVTDSFITSTPSFYQYRYKLNNGLCIEYEALHEPWRWGGEIGPRLKLGVYEDWRQYFKEIFEVDSYDCSLKNAFFAKFVEKVERGGIARPKPPFVVRFSHFNARLFGLNRA